MTTRVDPVHEATCVPHQNGGIPLKYIVQEYNKITCRLVLHTIPYVLNAKQGSCDYHISQVFLV